MITEIGSDVTKAARLLQAGELVAIPTETVYGLAGNALNESAVIKIFEAKERPQFNPLIIHLHDWNEVTKYVTDIPKEVALLAREFTPGPITFLLPKNTSVPDLVTSGSPKVAVRIPAHPLTRQLLSIVEFPLAAPSANRFGYVSPVNATHVKEGLDGRIPYILDGGECEVGVESTIVDFEKGRVTIRRTGKISIDQIEEVLHHKVLVQTHADDHPVAPGMLKSHYATHTPLYVGDLNQLNIRFQQKKRLLLGWGADEEILRAAGIKQSSKSVICRSLSPEKQIEEVARNLFAVMRQADQMGVEVILAMRFPEHGIGMAINDRLSRAQHPLKD